MIDGATRTRVAKRSPTKRRRHWRLTILLLVLLFSSGLAIRHGLERGDPVPALRGMPSVANTATPSAPSLAPSPSPSPTPAATPSPEKTPLRLPGAVPARGSGVFTYASRRGAVLGTNGPLRRFKVAVERGSNEDPDEFADQVEATLGDPRSWTGGGRLRLQLVAGADVADFTVLLATRDTAARMCLRGGTNIRIDGRPYTSCRTTGRAIINLDRWRLSARPYLAAKIPLAIYRQYVINHEVGHELGHHHEGCPKVGGPAPVMVQQTLTVRGCVPYSWPRSGNHFLTGPAL